MNIRIDVGQQQNWWWWGVHKAKKILLHFSLNHGILSRMALFLEMLEFFFIFGPPPLPPYYFPAKPGLGALLSAQRGALSGPKPYPQIEVSPKQKTNPREKEKREKTSPKSRGGAVPTINWTSTSLKCCESSLKQYQYHVLARRIFTPYSLVKV